MRIKFKDYLIFLLFVLISTSMPLEAQNLLSNYSFEQGRNTLNIQPNERVDFRHSAIWKGGEYCDIINHCIGSGSLQCDDLGILANSMPAFQAGPHASHWFKDDRYILEETINGQYSKIDASDGGSFAGVQRGTLIQQELNDRIRYDKSYRLTFKIRLPANYVRAVNVIEENNNGCRVTTDLTHPIYSPPYDWTGAKVNIYLASDDLEYDNNYNGGCQNPGYDDYIKVGGANYHYKAASIDIDISSYPVGEWHEVEMFLTTDALTSLGMANGAQTSATDKELPYDWIAIDFDHPALRTINPNSNYSSCNFPMLLIDEIVLEESECWECSNCSTKDKCLYPQINSNFDDGFFNCLRFEKLHNATSFFVEIYNEVGVRMDSFSVFTPPKTYYYDHIGFGNQPLRTGAYYILLKVRNDCQVTYTAKRVLLTEGQAYNSCNTSLTPNIPNLRVKGICCDEDLVIKNQILDENIFYRARSIKVGPRVTIKSGTEITFRAAKYISYSPDFTIENDVNDPVKVHAYIQQCTHEEITEIDLLTKPNESDIASNRMESKKSQKINTKCKFDVYPNPNTGQFNIEIDKPSKETAYFEVLNAQGQIIYQKVASSDNVLIDLKEVASGLYIVRVRIGSQWLNSKKLIIH